MKNRGYFNVNLYGLQCIDRLEIITFFVYRLSINELPQKKSFSQRKEINIGAIGNLVKDVIT